MRKAIISTFLIISLISSSFAGSLTDAYFKDVFYLFYKIFTFKDEENRVWC
jgi:hypothetical protein